MLLILLKHVSQVVGFCASGYHYCDALPLRHHELRKSLRASEAVVVRAYVLSQYWLQCWPPSNQEHSSTFSTLWFSSFVHSGEKCCRQRLSSMYVLDPASPSPFLIAMLGCDCLCCWKVLVHHLQGAHLVFISVSLAAFSCCGSGNVRFDVCGWSLASCTLTYRRVVSRNHYVTVTSVSW